MTRNKEASITNHNPSENVPDAILTLTKNVLGQNVTKTIEPMIKRIGIVETRDDPAVETTLTIISTTTIDPIRDFPVNATLITTNRDAKKKKTKTTSTKRKDQVVTTTTTTTTQKPLIHVDNRKFSHLLSLSLTFNNMIRRVREKIAINKLCSVSTL